MIADELLPTKYAQPYSPTFLVLSEVVCVCLCVCVSHMELTLSQQSWGIHGMSHTASLSLSLNWPLHCDGSVRVNITGSGIT